MTFFFAYCGRLLNTRWTQHTICLVWKGFTKINIINCFIIGAVALQMPWIPGLQTKNVSSSHLALVGPKSNIRKMSGFV